MENTGITESSKAGKNDEELNKLLAAMLAEKNMEEEDEVEIDLLDLFRDLRQHLFKIIVFFVVGGLLAFGFTKFVITPKYTATSRLYIISSGDSIVDLSSLQISSQLKSDYKELITSSSILEDTIAQLNLDMTEEELDANIEIENPTDTRILDIKATSTDPQLSVDIADKLAELAKNYLPQVMKTDAPVVFENAKVPKSPSSPSTVKNTAIGAVLFGAIEIAILVFRYVSNDTFTTPEDINKYFGFQPLASVPDGVIPGLDSQRRDREIKKNQKKRKKKKK